MNRPVKDSFGCTYSEEQISDLHLKAIEEHLDGGGAITIQNFYWHEPYVIQFGKDPEKGYWSRGLSDEDDLYSEESLEKQEKNYTSSHEEWMADLLISLLPADRDKPGEAITTAIKESKGTLKDG